ncbi:SPFH domain-containing protein [Dysgonomonas sp. BGC7]|uniref:SPFH domain-containing protein n=1 Tax=Dysgonomonas sp. BGC7 TaxID=1658008 RepID=UPI0006802C67|nr:SPFH domain-containing protein [Dysgonomonas sp. BGC7]MBD8388290.1 SPFH domain-containing protein [Dysgonomonas sp. BGC7]
MKTLEKNFEGVKISGFVVLFILIAILAVSIWFFTTEHLALFVIGFISIIAASLSTMGFMVVEPNNVRVMIFFGKYKGTITDNGFFWVNPFYNKKKLTTRARNLDVAPIKVNDKVGNPIMIGAVLVWKVKDTYKAMFDIDTSSISGIVPGTQNNYIQFSNRMQSYENFVQIQSDAAVRQVAGMYAYDSNESKDSQVTLRSDNGEINQKLEDELNIRLEIAGIEVIEARINYLAYAAEIASVMLRRQQADAIIAAREKIVEGAVSMVQLALDKLQKEEIVELDEEKKAAMVSNLLVVLCADEAAQPIVNTGTLYH